MRECLGEFSRWKLDARGPRGYNGGVRRRLLWLLLFLALVDGAAVCWWWYQRCDHSQDALILAAAQRYGVDPALVKAVVWRESRFDSKARGRAGEIGLMQIRAVAAGEWADAEHLPGFQPELLLNPTNNTLAGVWYLRRLLNRYPRTDNPLAYALADYNAGRSHVLRWTKGDGATNSAVFLRQMDFPGTRKYVEAVLQRYEHYRSIFPTRPAAK